MKRMLYVCAVLLLVSGCGRYRQGQSIEFIQLVTSEAETIYDVDAFYAGRTPALLVIAPGNLSALDQYIPKKQRALLQTTDLKGKLLIAVFQGVIGYADSGVYVRELVLDDHQLSVHVDFTEPSQTKLAMPQGSYSSFKVVAVERAALPSGPEPLLVQVVDQDDTLVVSTTVQLAP